MSPGGESGICSPSFLSRFILPTPRSASRPAGLSRTEPDRLRDGDAGGPPAVAVTMAPARDLVLVRTAVAWVAAPGVPMALRAARHCTIGGAYRFPGPPGPSMAMPPPRFRQRRCPAAAGRRRHRQPHRPHPGVMVVSLESPFRAGTLAGAIWCSFEFQSWPRVGEHRHGGLFPSVWDIVGPAAPAERLPRVPRPPAGRLRSMARRPGDAVQAQPTEASG